MGLKMTAGGIDWTHYEEKAARMTIAELFFAERDCHATAKNWDHAPYEHEAAKAGHYRDEASVYRAERKARRAAEDKEFKRKEALGTIDEIVF